LVEHHVAFISEIADVLTVMALGRVLGEGPAHQVLALPEEVEAYLGHMIGGEEPPPAFIERTVP
jgi:ABC-type branched-subunit amino acid transport system ATPase component